MLAPVDPIVRHFRQIVIWPLQLMPVRPGEQVQRHWEMLDACAGNSPWSRVPDAFAGGAGAFRERHYREFVTFLPYVQRLLYGAAAGQEAASLKGTRSLHIYRRTDVHRVRLVCQRGEPPRELAVDRVELYFFLDADIAILIFELHADEVPLSAAQDILFRFGRAYPGFWDAHGDGGNCPHRVEWLGADGTVLVHSDFAATSDYLDFAAQQRTPRIASHWEYLLRPLAQEYAGQAAALRYRQIEYYRMPVMSYLALDEPHQLTRAQFVRLGLVTNPGEAEDLPYSPETLRNFEPDYCNDSFWARSGQHARTDSRIIVTDSALVLIGCQRDHFYAGAETGVLAQFRSQYLLLFLLAHFRKAALLSLSDELSVAMNRLTVGDADSVRAFKRTIRQMMEVFLRFTHRYWFHEVSNQWVARDVFARLRRQLNIDELYQEVRDEVMDMNNYLDSDSARRQANTVLRLTVVTVFGLVGTVATGVLGMNLLDETSQPVSRRAIVFLLTLAVVVALTGFSVVRSKRLADALDALSDERVRWGAKWQTMRRALQVGGTRREP
jgi:CorA-like Mg2+ transporter protein